MRLHAKGRLKLTGKLAQLANPVVIKEWLDAIAPRGFRVFVQPPPTNSTDPTIILKYLARYVSGGPISNSRLVSWENGQVTFLARSKEDALPGQAKEKVSVKISEVKFVQRWAIHILPKSFTRVRHYGMSANLHRAAYLEKCRELRGIDEGHDNATDDAEQDREPVDRWDLEEEGPAIPTHRCPKCGRPMRCLEFSSRPSWKVTMTGKYRPEWYT